MAMTLRAGTPSVPSSAIGKATSSPAVASSVVGAERTGRGIADCNAGVGIMLGGNVTGLDQGVFITPRSKMAPTTRFGSSATKTRTATSVRIPDERVSNRLRGVWSVC
jgi:hypothetical protein